MNIHNVLKRASDNNVSRHTSYRAMCVLSLVNCRWHLRMTQYWPQNAPNLATLQSTCEPFSRSSGNFRRQPEPRYGSRFPMFARNLLLSRKISRNLSASISTESLPNLNVIARWLAAVQQCNVQDWMYNLYNTCYCSHTIYMGRGVTVVELRAGIVGDYVTTAGCLWRQWLREWKCNIILARCEGDV